MRPITLINMSISNSLIIQLIVTLLFLKMYRTPNITQKEINY